MRILVMNGPNLNLTGIRERDIYGSCTLEDINKGILNCAYELGCEVEFMQSNHEGILIDTIQAAMGFYDGIVINAGALAHYSYALRDAIACCGMPVVGVHMSDIKAREPFRALDVLEEVCSACVVGMGERGYSEALRIVFEKVCCIGK